MKSIMISSINRMCAGEIPQHPRNEYGSCVVNPPLHRGDGKPIAPPLIVSKEYGKEKRCDN